MMKHNLSFFHPRNISDNYDGGLDFCRFLEFGLRSEEERGLLSRTVAGNRAYQGG